MTLRKKRNNKIKKKEAAEAFKLAHDAENPWLPVLNGFTHPVLRRAFANHGGHPPTTLLFMVQHESTNGKEYPLNPILTHMQLDVENGALYAKALDPDEHPGPDQDSEIFLSLDKITLTDQQFYAIFLMLSKKFWGKGSWSNCFDLDDEFVSYIRTQFLAALTEGEAERAWGVAQSLARLILRNVGVDAETSADRARLWHISPLTGEKRFPGEWHCKADSVMQCRIQWICRDYRTDEGKRKQHLADMKIIEQGRNGPVDTSIGNIVSSIDFDEKNSIPIVARSKYRDDCFTGSTIQLERGHQRTTFFNSARSGETNAFTNTTPTAQLLPTTTASETSGQTVASNELTGPAMNNIEQFKQSIEDARDLLTMNLFPSLPEQSTPDDSLAVPSQSRRVPLFSTPIFPAPECTPSSSISYTSSPPIQELVQAEERWKTARKGLEKISRHLQEKEPPIGRQAQHEKSLEPLRVNATETASSSQSVFEDLEILIATPVVDRPDELVSPACKAARKLGYWQGRRSVIYRKKNATESRTSEDQLDVLDALVRKRREKVEDCKSGKTNENRDESTVLLFACLGSQEVLEFAERARAKHGQGFLDDSEMVFLVDSTEAVDIWSSMDI